MSIHNTLTNNLLKDLLSDDALVDLLGDAGSSEVYNRLLEDGNDRLLEDGSFRLLE
jgi:hypothetical protein